MIADAQNGDQIVFDDGPHGQTITPTSGELALGKDLDIKGPGADALTISGNHAGRVFDVSGGVTVTIAGLTIADGEVGGAEYGGAEYGEAVSNRSSTLILAQDIPARSEAHGAAGGHGGTVASFSGATLTVTDCLFIQNQASSGPNADSTGGAVLLGSSTARITRTTFLDNQAIGNNRPGGGGAIHDGFGSSLTITDSTFIGNEAIAGDGGVVSATSNFAGFGRGGGIYGNMSTLTVEDSRFTDNQGIGGNGGSGGGGASAFYILDDGVGGGIFNDDATLSSDASGRCESAAQT